MQNRDFFYLQYNKINWANQEKTKINSFINDYIIKNVIKKHSQSSIAIFDIGFGVGFFIRMLLAALKGVHKDILIEGCEPSEKNFNFFLSKRRETVPKGITLNAYKTTFQDVKTENTFDFITAIYVFPAFIFDDLEKVIAKAHTLLNPNGRFVFTVSNEEYLDNKLKTEKDLSIQTQTVSYRGKEYREILHYADIPEIGKVIDYNREDRLYLDLFSANSFELERKEVINDNGFLCTLFVFKKL